MWFCSAERMAVPERFCTHCGVWLCHNSVWPCTIWLLATAFATTPSAWSNVKLFCDGSVLSHFSAFSWVTWLNSVPARLRYVAFCPEVQAAVLLQSRAAL